MLNYKPSWIDDCYTLLSKVNKCIEKVEEVLATLDGKQDKLSTAQLTAVNSGITRTKVEHYDTIPVVAGNPSESGSTDLTKIKIGNTVYLIPEGTVVEGNPSESGSTDLTKIKIGNTVYNIPSGGNIYLHQIYILGSSVEFTIYVVNTRQNAITTIDYIIDNLSHIPYNCFFKDGIAPKIIDVVSLDFDSTTNSLMYDTASGSGGSEPLSGISVSDTVKQL